MTHNGALSRNSLTTTMLVEESEECIMVRLKRAHVEDKDLRKIRVKIEHVVNCCIQKNDILT